MAVLVFLVVIESLALGYALYRLHFYKTLYAEGEAFVKEVYHQAKEIPAKGIEAVKKEL